MLQIPPSQLCYALLVLGFLFVSCRPTPLDPTATAVLLATPTGEPLVAMITPPTPAVAALRLPAPLYFLGADDQLWRLGQDGLALSQLTTEPYPITDFDLAPATGALAYVTGESLPTYIATSAQLIVADALGQNRQSLPLTSGVSTVRWSPDGQFIAYDSAEGIYVGAPGGTPELRLAVADESEQYTVVSWSPDGNLLLVSKWGRGMNGWGNYVLNLQDNTLLPQGQSCCYPVWRQDSSGVYYAMDGLGEVQPGLWFVSVASGQVQPLVKPVNPQAELLPWVAHPYNYGDTLLAFVGTGIGSGWPFALTLSQIQADGTTTPKRSEAYPVREALWAADGSGVLTVAYPAQKDGAPVGEIAWLGLANEPAVALGQRGYKLRWGR